jgi:hypothetical protein
MSGTSHAYLFEAKGIQRYIFDSGRLADVVGGSDLISGLCASDEEDALVSLVGHVFKDQDGPDFSRRAGGAFCMHHADVSCLRRFQRLWRLWVGVNLPGLEFSDAVAENATNPTHAYRKVSAVRENTAAFLPPAGHVYAAINPRTGRTATEEIKEEIVDAVVAPQRRRAHALAEEASVGASPDRVADKFAGNSHPDDRPGLRLRFPRHFDAEEATQFSPAFPFKSVVDGEEPDRRVALIHADISGLGQVFTRLTAAVSSPAEVREVSNEIENAIERAAQAATRHVLLVETVTDPHEMAKRGLIGDVDPAEVEPFALIPARPILLGGDDIAILVRADLALPFAKVLLSEIETRTRAAFDALRDQHPVLPPCLSACTGIAIVGAGHPSLAAHELAEGLCSYAKKAAKQAAREGGERVPPSMLAFATVTSTVQEGWDTLHERDYCAAPDPSRTAAGDRLGALVYRVSDETGHTGPIDTLFELARALDALEGKGKLHLAIRWAFDEWTECEKAWNRFFKVAEGDAKTSAEDALAALGAQRQDNEDVCIRPDAQSIALVNDALELIDIGTALASGTEPETEGEGT